MGNQSFNEDAYFRQATQCFSKSLAGLRDCLGKIHASLFEEIRLWTIMLPYRDPQDRSVDCVYSIEKKYFKTIEVSSDIMKYNYHFTISQSKCESEWKVPGGASFLINVYDVNGLVACRTRDTFDNSYHVMCSFHRFGGSIKEVKMQYPSCINMTVLLEYEHYDAYTEALTGETFPSIKRYYSLRHVLVDNKQFCFLPTDHHEESGLKRSDKSLNRHDLSSHVKYIINGQWLGMDNCPSTQSSDCSLYLNESLIKAYDNHKKANQLSSIALGREWNNTQYSEIIRSVDVYGKKFGDNYLFHPMIWKWPHRDGQTENHSDKSMKISSDSAITFNPHDMSKLVHFIGSSHLRNAFDAINEYYSFGYYPKDQVQSHNMKSYHSISQYSSIFADDQADCLSSLCSSFSKSNLNHTIVFQTGVWDLTFTPIRRMLHDSNTASKLASRIIRILDGRIACRGLRHFIWLTETPNSPCLNEDDITCRDTLGYRTNGGLAALNEYYLYPLMNATVSPGIDFTIIDAYSIMLPRVQLLPDTEYDCSFHYHCKSYSKEYIDQKTLQLSHTPAGDAMTKAILLALSLQE